MYADYEHMNMFYGMGMLFWVVIFIIILMLVLRYFKKDDCGIKKDTAFDILKKRYAKGEIGKKEFEEIKKELES